MRNVLTALGIVFGMAAFLVVLNLIYFWSG
jgi:hypothetical protein